MAVAALLLFIAGCATGTLDRRARHVVSLGIGGASFVNEAVPLELHRTLGFHGTYAYRLTKPHAWIGVSARVLANAVFASVHGEGVVRPCDLFWTFAGPAIGVQVPTHYPLSFVADGGAGLVHVSRGGCSESRRTTSTALTPRFGFGLQFGLAPRAAWRMGFGAIRLPLDQVAIGREPRWAGTGEFALIFAL